MIKNYLKIAWRHLLKNKTHSLINILGLSIAFVCSILLFMNAFNELSFDTFHPDLNQLYKVYTYSKNTEGDVESTTMSYPVAPTLKKEFSEISASTRFMWGGSGIEYNGKKLDLPLNLVDNDFFKIFNFPIVKGNAASSLQSIGDVVLSEGAAKQLFNTEDPIGKIVKVKVRGQWKDLQVSAIAKDAPENSSIDFSVLVRIELADDYELNKTNWNNQQHQVYVKLTKGSSPKELETKFRAILRKYQPTDTAFMKGQGGLPDENGDYYALKLFPFSENHFHEALGSGNQIVSKTYIYSILLIAIFILTIACFNFINLNIAQSFSRSKEVGVRKCLGAHKTQIFTQVWGESLLVCAISLLTGIGLSLLIHPYFNQVFSSNLELSSFYKPSTIIILLLIIVFVSLLAGGYPALLISKLNTIKVLKGSNTLKKPGAFRNSLVIIQFTMACLLMACTIIAYKQLDYMRTMPLGFNKESIISLPVYNSKDGREFLNKFRMKFANNPWFISLTGSNINIGLGKDGSTSKQSNGFSYKDKSIFTNRITTDYDFLKTLGIKLINGRDFSREYGTDATSGVLVSESMAKQFGVKDAIGLTFSMDSTKADCKIIGVIPDFHLYSLHEKSEPLMIDISVNSYLHYIFIKVKSQNLLQAMDEVKNYYKELEPGKEFRGTFLDENTDNWYRKEKRLSLLLGIASAVAILLSCMGLFGLAMLMIQQRIKEIGVRKVLGASVLSINQLLTKDFIKLVLVAILISSPLAWWLMTKWLEDFPYRTNIHWYLFLLIGGMALFISLITISFHTVKAALSNPVKSLRTE